MKEITTNYEKLISNVALHEIIVQGEWLWSRQRISW